MQVSVYNIVSIKMKESHETESHEHREYYLKKLIITDDNGRETEISLFSQTPIQIEGS